MSYIPLLSCQPADHHTPFLQFPDKPVCDKDTNRCVQCKANANCKDEVLKYCDIPNTTCVECRADARECFL